MDNETDQAVAEMTHTMQSAGVAGQQLRGFIERIERLTAEKEELAADVKDIKGQAKDSGLSVDGLNYCLQRRRDPELAAKEEIRDIYWHACSGAPEGQAGDDDE